MLYHWRWAWTRAAGWWNSRCGTISMPQPASVRGVTGSTNTYSCCITDAEPEHALPGGEAAGAGPSSRHSPPRSAGWQVVLILTHAVSLTLSLNARCRAVKQQVQGPSSHHSPPRSAGWQVVLILIHAVSLTLSLNTRSRVVKQQVRDHLRATARLGPRCDR